MHEYAPTPVFGPCSPVVDGQRLELWVHVRRGTEVAQCSLHLQAVEGNEQPHQLMTQTWHDGAGMLRTLLSHCCGAAMCSRTPFMPSVPHVRQQQAAPGHPAERPHTSTCLPCHPPAAGARQIRAALGAAAPLSPPSSLCPPAAQQLHGAVAMACSARVGSWACWHQARVEDGAQQNATLDVGELDAD